MTDSDHPDWSEIRRLYAGGEITIAAIAERHGVSVQRIARRARNDGWPSRQRRVARKRDRPADQSGRKPVPVAAKSAAARGAGQSLKARRALVRRLYKAIDTKLQQMERRMAHDMATEQGTETSATDHERDTRAIGALIANLSRVTEIEADLERIPGAASANATEQADRQLADEAERFRREVAERLARLVRPA